MFVTKGLENDPDADVTEAPQPGAPLHSFGQRLDADEELLLDALLQKLTNLTKFRGLIVKAFFLDHDRHNAGFVTPAQFRRAITSCFKPGTLGDIDLQLLEKAYGDGKDVNYRQLHIDVTPEATSRERNATLALTGTMKASRRVPALDAGADAINVQGVLDRIIRQTASKRVRMRDFFKEFDPMRTGHCTPSQFKRALISCQFQEVTAADMTALANNFANVRG